MEVKGTVNISLIYFSDFGVFVYWNNLNLVTENKSKYIEKYVRRNKLWLCFSC